MVIGLLVLILLAIVFPGLVRGLFVAAATFFFYIWLVHGADACSPAPSCWMDSKNYLSAMCKQEARRGSSIADLRRMADEGDEAAVDRFAAACLKIGVRFKP